MRIESDVAIAMDDGIVLRADLFVPIEDGEYPTLLGYGPYGKGLAFQEGYKPQWDYMLEKYPEVGQGTSSRHQSWEVVDPERWVPAGYVCVRVDSRETGRSPGYMDVWSGRETVDLYDCIEWAASQPWSNGRVGLAGISYYAMNQYQVAALQPPHLAAICPWEGASPSWEHSIPTRRSPRAGCALRIGRWTRPGACPIGPTTPTTGSNLWSRARPMSWRSRSGPPPSSSPLDTVWLSPSGATTIDTGASFLTSRNDFTMPDAGSALSNMAILTTGPKTCSAGT
jgi:hypothetical protein